MPGSMRRHTGLSMCLRKCWTIGLVARQITGTAAFGIVPRRSGRGKFVSVALWLQRSRLVRHYALRRREYGRVTGTARNNYRQRHGFRQLERLPACSFDKVEFADPPRGRAAVRAFVSSVDSVFTGGCDPGGNRMDRDGNNRSLVTAAWTSARARIPTRAWRCTRFCSPLAGRTVRYFSMVRFVRRVAEAVAVGAAGLAASTCLRESENGSGAGRA